MNLNEFAREVCKREGKKVNLSIAQVKEVLKCERDFILRKTGLDINQARRMCKKRRKK